MSSGKFVTVVIIVSRLSKADKYYGSDDLNNELSLLCSYASCSLSVNRKTYDGQYRDFIISFCSKTVPRSTNTESVYERVCSTWVFEDIVSYNSALITSHGNHFFNRF